VTYWPSYKYTTEDCVFKCLDLIFVVFSCDLMSVSTHPDNATYSEPMSYAFSAAWLTQYEPCLHYLTILLWVKSQLSKKRPSKSNIARYSQRKDKRCPFSLRSQDHHKTKDKVGALWLVAIYYDYLQEPPAGPYAVSEAHSILSLFFVSYDFYW